MRQSSALRGEETAPTHRLSLRLRVVTWLLTTVRLLRRRRVVALRSTNTVKTSSTSAVSFQSSHRRLVLRKLTPC